MVEARFYKRDEMIRAETRYLLLAIVTGAVSWISEMRAQEAGSSPQTRGQPGVTIEEVIVTGSNIPPAEETGPYPVDVYDRDEIARLGVRTATDLIQKIPEAMGASITENNVN